MESETNMKPINFATRRSGWYDHAGNPIPAPPMATEPEYEPDGFEEPELETMDGERVVDPDMPF